MPLASIRVGTPIVASRPRLWLPVSARRRPADARLGGVEASPGCGGAGLDEDGVRLEQLATGALSYRAARRSGCEPLGRGAECRRELLEQLPAARRLAAPPG